MSVILGCFRFLRSINFLPFAVNDVMKVCMYDVPIRPNLWAGIALASFPGRVGGLGTRLIRR